MGFAIAQIGVPKVCRWHQGAMSTCCLEVKPGGCTSGPSLDKQDMYHVSTPNKLPCQITTAPTTF